ncbi:regulatory protein YycI of two-component signal transduction system YycFG [Enterococcus sp. PF1-24]|uniref:two-component system regulatory protein YycI n=1 Tax=unclassified Enterococcus TaxID=2608891 RepID=UPI002475442A|nr:MULTISPECIES: two-component system regulatory protein YycI [unclassified Enterococcus]MDH6363572.1 regulatory protein YycI of two-component signal transduction system YycFG [Enterococcus sp. PFB1-1]MDH6400807.1 regulatory protein YycI of two-component signal transduction system YycFG [Enterococcus sp. PF1-24]
MNFKRIEWVFVVAFCLLNIFLFVLYQDGVKETHNVTSSNKTESIETLLKKDQITFNDDFSQERLSGYYLSGEQLDFNQYLKEQSKTVTGNKTTNRDYTLTEILDSKQLLQADQLSNSLQSFFAKDQFILFSDEYQYLENLSIITDEDLEVVAGQTFEGIPFNDEFSKLVLKLAKDNDEMYQIESYSQTYIINIQELREKMELYSEREAIQTLYKNSRLPKGSEILWTQLAYSRIMDVYEKDIYVPVWFVALKTEDSQQIESVNALNNTVITTNTVLKVASE